MIILEIDPGNGMYIEDIQIENFRLLQDANIQLEKQTTVIVGRNNSGKTSLTEIFRRLLQDGSPVFRLEDFSLSAHELFWTAFSSKLAGKDESEIRSSLPAIKVTLTVSYDKTANLGALSEFIIDLDDACTKTKIEIRYELEDGKLQALFASIELDPKGTEENNKVAFFKKMKEVLPKLYKTSLFAIDPNDESNEKAVEWNRLASVIQAGFINAQRGLDDTTHKDNAVLGKIFGVLFETALSASALPTDQTTAQVLTDAVHEIQEEVDTKFNSQLNALVPAFKLFGYPGLSDPKLRTETTFDVERLLTNYTKVVYSGTNGVHLPEAFNGLGARNLIYILLKLYEFFKTFKTTPCSPGVHIIFIEEPEAHLHPQMQEVFIKKLSEVAAAFAKDCGDGEEWPVQFIVTTHSSHMANRASFSAIRYFLVTETKQSDITYCRTKIKDLNTGLTGISADDKKFLHQYMTLTRCDLLFADKIILIEGTSERLLLPKIIEKLDNGKQPEEKLSSQYISIMEVGGAYAHKFFDLLNFLELKTLIITDLDSAKLSGRKYKAEPVQSGTRTTNSCLKTWFEKDDISPTELLAKVDAEKIKEDRRIAYQIPETPGDLCGRSFEEAFILANTALFDLTSTTAWDLAGEQKKSEFALKHAIDVHEWNSPRYITEGLIWLSQNQSPIGAIVAPTPEE